MRLGRFGAKPGARAVFTCQLCGARIEYAVALGPAEFALRHSREAAHFTGRAELQRRRTIGG